MLAQKKNQMFVLNTGDFTRSGAAIKKISEFLLKA
jgi:hypothetical protein